MFFDQAHRAGDAVLQTLSCRLRNRIREMDTAARLGGDEFGLILADAGAPTDVAGVLEKVIEACAQPAMFDGRQITFSVSIGASLYPTHKQSVHELWEYADRAMYGAKRAGGGCYRLCGQCHPTQSPLRSKSTRCDLLQSVIDLNSKQIAIVFVQIDIRAIANHRHASRNA